MDDFFTYGDKQYNRAEFEKLMKGLLEFYRRDSRLRSAQKMISGKNVLDIGCHLGFFSRILAENGKEVVGIDVLESSINIAKTFNQVKGVEYKCGDIFNLKFRDNEFDSIVFLETIEHVQEPVKFLREFFRILKPGGNLVISTPNSVSYINILHQLLLFTKKGQNKYIYSLKTEPRNTGTQLDHVFAWDFRTILRLLIRNGFEYSGHKFAGAYPLKLRIGKLSLNIMGNNELKFLLPLLGPYLMTLIVSVKKPCKI